jgi:phasin family protein
MKDRNAFDMNTILESYRSAFAPVLRAQQDSLKTLEKIARHQYAIAGDYLEWSLSSAKTVATTQDPNELFTKSAELNARFGEQFNKRFQELVHLSADVQSSLVRIVEDTGAKIAESAEQMVKKAA